MKKDKIHNRFFSRFSFRKRNPLPKDKADKALVLGMRDIRYWADDVPRFVDEIIAEFRSHTVSKDPEFLERPFNYLAISGGGSNGAFGAGLLNGWTEAGDRPEFQIVTGISTGALIAPMAFLGPGYDWMLKEIYTKISTKDILNKKNPLKIIFGDSAVDSRPLKQLIRKYFTLDVMKEIAAEHETGRRLAVGTTNLDAKRSVYWRIGNIASSGHPKALELIIDILLASASIPGAFPPVYFEVEADGALYDEMHVDGGAASQVFIYPSKFDYRKAFDEVGFRGEARIFVIRNAKLHPPHRPVKKNILSVSQSSIATLISNQGLGDLYRIYLTAKRDGFDFNLAYIPSDFKEKPKEQFDREYMNKLYELGYNLAKSGYPWKKAPAGFEKFSF